MACSVNIVFVEFEQSEESAFGPEFILFCGAEWVGLSHPKVRILARSHPVLTPLTPVSGHLTHITHTHPRATCIAVLESKCFLRISHADYVA